MDKWYGGVYEDNKTGRHFCTFAVGKFPEQPQAKLLVPLEGDQRIVEAGKELEKVWEEFKSLKAEVTPELYSKFIQIHNAHVELLARIILINKYIEK